MAKKSTSSPEPTPSPGEPTETPVTPSPQGEAATQVPKVRKIARPSTPRCGARNRQGNPCGNAAGFKTDHPGQGRCHLHGGKTPAPTGRYSKVKRVRLRELIEQFENDPDPLNLLPEAKLLRSLTHDYIDRFEEQDQMLTRWHLSFEKAFQADWAAWWATVRADALESGNDGLNEALTAKMPDPMSYLPGRPLRMADLSDVAGLVNQIGAMVERIRKSQTSQTFSMDTVSLLWRTMAGHLTQAAVEVIEDDDIRSAFLTAVEEKWGRISLAELASRRPEDGAGDR
jgi:hypothetical protein